MIDIHIYIERKDVRYVFSFLYFASSATSLIVAKAAPMGRSISVHTQSALTLVNHWMKASSELANFWKTKSVFLDEEFPKLSIRSDSHYNLGSLLNKRGGINDAKVRAPPFLQLVTILALYILGE